MFILSFVSAIHYTSSQEISSASLLFGTLIAAFDEWHGQN
jgi:hypothetical protein